MIAIVDYGLGNPGSVYNMLRRLGLPAEVTSDSSVLESASHYILPGVGAFDAGVLELRARGLWPVLQEQVLERKKPLLGICLGMQLLARRSEEGREAGLGWIDAEFRRFPAVHAGGGKLRVPNIGWNYIQVGRENELTLQLPAKTRFYFVHSYYAVLHDPALAFMSCSYDGFEYVCAYRKDNIWGVQFHPEKSHAFGMRLLQNFAVLKG